jgi:hypothetical protein
MPAMRTLVVLAVALAAAASAGAATIESGVAGRKLVLVDRYAFGNAKVVYVAKAAPGIAKGDPGDPPGLDGTVEIFPLADPGNVATYGLSGGWLVNRPTVAKYANPSAAVGGLGAAVLVVKPELLAKLVARNLGDGDYLSGDQGPGDLDLQTLTASDTLRVRVTVVNATDGNTYVFCSDFTALGLKLDDMDRPFKVVAKTSSAPPSCAVGATTTTTTP